MAVPRAEELPSGRWRAVATIDRERRARTFDSQGQALHWADLEMRRAELAGRLASAPAARAEQAMTLASFAEWGYPLNRSCPGQRPSSERLAAANCGFVDVHRSVVTPAIPGSQVEPRAVRHSGELRLSGDP